MPRPLTKASRWAAVGAGLLALVLLGRALQATSTTVTVLEAVLSLLTVLGGVKMWLHNCFESHLVTVLAAGATAIGTLLTITVGMPGSTRAPVAPTHVVTLALTAAIGVLFVLDARERLAER